MQGTESSWQAILYALRTVSSTDEQSRLIDGMLTRRQPATLVFVNAHLMNLAKRDPLLAQALQDSSHLLRDGSGVALLMSILGRESGMNMNGTDLIPKILARHGGRRVALFGTQDPWLTESVEAIAARYGIRFEDIVCMDGFQSDEHYVRLARNFRPGIVVLGMGSPKQERVGQLIARHLDAPCLIISGGAILDFHADRFPRAPAWMQATGIEWLFRLSREPRRLFKRYVIGNPLFVFRALGFAWSRWEFRSATAWSHGPLTEINLVPPDEPVEPKSVRPAREGWARKTVESPARPEVIER